jgi:hypothetical protein
MPGSYGVHVGVPVCVVACTGLGAGENEPAHQVVVAEREGLRDVAADRETEDVDVRQAQRVDECGRVIGLRFDRTPFAVTNWFGAVAWEGQGGSAGSVVMSYSILVLLFGWGCGRQLGG